MNKIKTVTCKKDLLDESVMPANFIKGMQYNFSVDDDDVNIFVFNKDSSTFGRRFYLYKKYIKADYPNFYDHFYNEQEIRKLKLDKLNVGKDSIGC